MTDPKQSWEQVGERLSELGNRLRRHFEAEQAAAETEAAKDALRKVMDSMGHALEALSNAVRDPGVQEEAKHAARSLGDAVTTTVDKLGAELRAKRERRDEGESPPSG